MASVVDFGRVGRGLLPLILAGAIAGCGSGEEVSAPPSSATPTTTIPATAEPASFELDSLASVDTSAIIAGFLREVTEDDIEVVEGDSGTSYRYVFPTRELTDGVTVDLTAQWDPVEGGLQPSLEWALTGDASIPTEFSFVASIPKLFGDTVDDMTFDPQPTEIIDADVVAAWDVQLSTHATIHALSSRLIKEGDPSAVIMIILDHLNTQRAHAELTACYAPFRRTDAIAQCYLAVVAQNAQSFNERSCDAVGRMVYNLAATTSHDSVLPGISAACKSVIQLATTGTPGGCENVTGSDASGDYLECHDWVARLLVGACPHDGSVEYQICVYEAAVALDRARDCDWIDQLGDPEMADDCRATITRDPSYCARTDDAALRASCCETFRETDVYDTCIGDSQDTAADASTTTTSEGATTTVADDTTTTEPGEEDLPPAIPAGVYTGSFDARLLTMHFSLDSAVTVLNTITVAIDGSGSISGDFAAHQTGSMAGCPGGLQKLIGTIDAGQNIGPTLPQTVTATATWWGNLTFTSDPTGFECVSDPEVWTEPNTKPLVFESIQNGVLTGIVGIYLPFELERVP